MAGRYLLHFAHEHIPFRWPEFLALATKNNCDINLISPKEHLSKRPFILIQLEDGCDEGNLIKSANESYLLKDLYELWALSKESVEDLAAKASRTRHFERCKNLHSTKPDQSFSIRCESFGAKITQSTKIDMISKMSFVQAFEPAPLNLNNPDHTYCIFQMTDGDKSCYVSDEQTGPKEYYFGRHLTRSSRSLVERFSLKRRNFIANTSMDPLLSLIAANTAKVRPNDLIFDPFVGSGSLLVAAAHLGAYVLGTDIDWQLLHGKSKPSRKGMSKRNDDECVRANLKQYGLEDRYIDVMVSDISRHPVRSGFEFDAIIADPPYGIRESSERIGKKLKNQVIECDRKTKFPSKILYHTADLISDLLNFAVNHLRLNGRLVYYLPVTLESADDEFDRFIPSHPSLELVTFCDQQLTRKTYRLMVVMEKMSNPADRANRVSIPPSLLNMDFRSTYFSPSKAPE